MSTRENTKARFKEALLKAIDEKPEHSIKEMTIEILLFICFEVIMAIGFIYYERSHIYRCGVWWEKIEAFAQEIGK